MFSFTELLIDLLITVIIYSLPLWLYKLIKGKEIPRKKAKKISILYGIFAYILYIIIYISLESETAPSIGPALLWSYINYRVLIRPTNKKDIYDYIVTKLKIYDVQNDTYREIIQRFDPDKFPKEIYSDGEYYYAFEKEIPGETRLHVYKPLEWYQKIESLKNTNK